MRTRLKSKCLLLVGSPKGARSTSEALGTYLAEQLGKRGCRTKKIRVYSALRSGEGEGRMLSAFKDADVLILAFPLYTDSVPWGVVRTMEIISEHYREQKAPFGQRLIAVSNSGFPEARHSDSALAVCRLFCREVGIEWAGGLALGAGQSIDGRPLEKAGGMVRNVRKALEQAADDLAEGNPLSERAIAIMAKPMVPKWMYLCFGSMGWKRKAKRHGARSNIHDRPYEYR